MVLLFSIIAHILYKLQLWDKTKGYIGVLFAFLTVIQLNKYIVNPSSLVDDVLVGFNSNEVIHTETVAEVAMSTPESTKAPIEVIIPKKQDETKSSVKSNTTVNETNKEQTSISVSKPTARPVLLNVNDYVRRSENNILIVKWTPIANIENYIMHVSLDDPLEEYNLDQDIVVNTNWYEMDISDFPSKTVIFISVSAISVNGEESESEVMNFKIEG